MAVTISPRTRTVVLLQGEDEEELNRLIEHAAALREQADKLRRSRKTRPAPPVLLADVDDLEVAENAATDAERAADVFAGTAQDRGIRVVLRSVGRKKWAELTGKHPPREGDEGDKIARYNVDTAPDDIVPACLASPALPDEERSVFLDSLSFAQFDYLALLAHQLNKALGADPTLRLLSASGQSSNGTSS